MERKMNKRTAAVLVSLALLLCVAGGSTVAYLVSHTSVTNVFVPAEVSCAVSSTAEEDTYCVWNIGNVDAYVRVTVVANWKRADGAVYAKAPVLGVDYTLETEGAWETGEDGYLYCTELVSAEDSFGKISVILNDTTSPADGYTLSVEVLASAIQATAEAVKEWSGGTASVSSDGTLVIEQGGE